MIEIRANSSMIPATNMVLTKGDKVIGSIKEISTVKKTFTTTTISTIGAKNLKYTFPTGVEPPQLSIGFYYTLGNDNALNFFNDWTNRISSYFKPFPNETDYDTEYSGIYESGLSILIANYAGQMIGKILLVDAIITELEYGSITGDIAPLECKATLTCRDIRTEKIIPPKEPGGTVEQ